MDDLSADLLASLADPERQASRFEARGWSLRGQALAVFDAYCLHHAGGSRQVATDRELWLVQAIIEAGWVPPSAREFFTRMDPAGQPKREEEMFERREWMAAEHERMERLRMERLRMEGGA